MGDLDHLKQPRHTRIVSQVLEAAYKLKRADCDTERLCYLVSDEEWQQLVDYGSWFRFDGCSEPAHPVNMHFSGIEIIKRSAVHRG